MTSSTWAENIILVDADFLDSVAFDLTVNFERMIERRIPPADLCHWLDCIALDGGLEPGDNAIQAIFLHDRQRSALANFVPADYAEALDAKAFKDSLGEFSLSSFPVEEVVSKADFFVQSLENVLASAEVKRVMIVADMAAYGAAVKHTVAQVKDKAVTLFAMEPVSGRGFTSEILGYSLLSALGIKSEEIR